MNSEVAQFLWEVRVSDTSSRPSEPRQICNTCRVELAMYTCPRCEKKYCSLSCYRKHGEACTEEFYKQQFISTIRSQRPATEQEKRKLLEILDREQAQRQQDEAEMKCLFGTESFDDNSMEKNVREKKESIETAESSNFDPYDPQLYERVPSGLASEMNEWIKSGSHLSVVKPWIPWWYRGHLTPEISITGEHPETSDGLDDETCEHNNETVKLELEPAASPQILDSVPSISSLTKSRPSPLNLFNITNVIYAYVYAKLTYNGDWDEDIESEIVDVLLSTSMTLSKSFVYQCATTACQSALEASIQLVYLRRVPAFHVSIIRDVMKIFTNGSLFIQACLSELYRLFSKQSDLCTHKKQSRLLKNIARKLLFMTSWCKDQTEIQPYECVCRELEAMLLEKELDMAPCRRKIKTDRKIQLIEDEEKKI